MKGKWAPAWPLLLLGCVALWLAGCSARSRLRLATTTTTVDSGLIDALLPAFEAESGLAVDVIVVGSGEALALGRAGDVDVLLVHAPEAEGTFMREGHGRRREAVMYNDFVLVGPLADPAGIADLGDAAAALVRIGVAMAPFISRGDESGTHLREQALWAAAGVTPRGDWYRSVGQGMGATLTVAAEQQAYTLSDRATFTRRVSEGLDLNVLVEGDRRLRNDYSVITVEPDRHPGVNGAGADLFIDWLLSPATQAAIAAFRIDGRQVFFVGSAG